MTQTLLGCIFALWLLKATAFVHQSPSFVRSSSQLNVFDPGSFPDRVSAASNFWISTIDSDIASIPNDQFGLVFAGGIMVMVGGVLSAVIVGFLLEKGDLYASIAAESYLQSAEDEEFWKGLSDEEQSKAREIMEKIKTSKSGVMMPEASSEPVLASSSSLSSPVEPKRKEPSKPADMFSDYGD